MNVRFNFIFWKNKKINNDEGGKKKKRKNFHNEKFFNGANKNEEEEMKRKRRGWIFINYFQNVVRKNGKRNEIFHPRGFL